MWIYISRYYLSGSAPGALINVSAEPMHQGQNIYNNYNSAILPSAPYASNGPTTKVLPISSNHDSAGIARGHAQHHYPAYNQAVNQQHPLPHYSTTQQYRVISTTTMSQNPQNNHNDSGAGQILTSDSQNGRNLSGRCISVPYNVSSNDGNHNSTLSQSTALNQHADSGAVPYTCDGRLLYQNGRPVYSSSSIINKYASEKRTEAAATGDSKSLHNTSFAIIGANSNQIIKGNSDKNPQNEQKSEKKKVLLLDMKIKFSLMYIFIFVLYSIYIYSILHYTIYL